MGVEEWILHLYSKVCCARRKFKEFSGILTRKLGGVFKAERESVQVYVTCVRSAMVYGSETWAMNVEQSARLERTEMRMV